MDQPATNIQTAPREGLEPSFTTSTKLEPAEVNAAWREINDFLRKPKGAFITGPGGVDRPDETMSARNNAAVNFCDAYGLALTEDWHALRNQINVLQTRLSKMEDERNQAQQALNEIRKTPPAPPGA